MTNGFPAEKVTFRSQGYGKQVLKGREEGEKAGDLDDFQGVKFCTKAFKVFVPMPWKLQLTLALLLFYGIRTKDNSQRRSELPWEKCPSPHHLETGLPFVWDRYKRDNYSVGHVIGLFVHPHAKVIVSVCILQGGVCKYVFP